MARHNRREGGVACECRQMEIWLHNYVCEAYKGIVPFFLRLQRMKPIVGRRGFHLVHNSRLWKK